MQRPQENVMKESVTENKTLTLTDCGFQGVNKKYSKKMRGKSIVLRCYRYNAKKRMQTSKGLGSQVCCGETQ
jgi:hypothetical protein